jgi:hypothetical protein
MRINCTHSLVLQRDGKLIKDYIVNLTEERLRMKVIIFTTKKRDSDLGHAFTGSFDQDNTD